MAVYVIDAPAAVELARRGYTPDGERDLFAPTLLRSQVLALLHRDAAVGRIPAEEAWALAERACRLPRRLLGDSVLRRTAWKLAAEHGWADTYGAEYVALTRLHAVALVTADEELRRAADGIVPTTTVDGFLTPQP